MRVDRRSLRTESAIKQALMTLLMDKELTKITVTAIAKEANIERKTFYLHYDSVDAVVSEIEQDLQSQLTDSLNKQAPLTAQGLVKALSQLMVKNQTFYQHVLNTSPNIFLNDDFQLILQRALEHSFLRSSGKAAHYQAIFLSSGIVAAYRNYLQDPQDSLTTVNATILKFLQSSLKK